MLTWLRTLLGVYLRNSLKGSVLISKHTKMSTVFRRMMPLGIVASTQLPGRSRVRRPQMKKKKKGKENKRKHKQRAMLM